MTDIIASVVAMIEALLPSITSTANAALIGSILNALSGMLPFIVQEIESLYQPVKNIINALSANPAALADQLATLQELDAQVDAAFEDAAKDTDAGI